MENKAMDLKQLKEPPITPELKDVSNPEITEEFFKKCGGYGLFQKILTVYALIFSILTALANISMVFIREDVPFSCYPSNFNDSQIPLNITLDEFLNNVTVEEDQCSVYNLDVGEEGFYVLPTRNSTKEPCNNYRKFYTKEQSSIVSEFDLVCGREWMKNVAVSIQFTGTLFGNLVFGVFSDKFGRFKAFCIGEALYLCCGILKIFSPIYNVFITFYFFEGFGYGGIYITLYTLLLECVTQDSKMTLNFAMNGIFAIGEIILAGVAYLLWDWKHLIIAAYMPHALLLIVGLKYLPESPRWLLNQKKFEEVAKLFNKIASTNGIEDDNMVENLIQKIQREAENKSKLDVEVDDKTYTTLDLLKKPRRAMISLNLWFSWCITSMLYYGVTLNSVDMSGNQYINFLLMSVVEIPANILGCILFYWFGHRKPLCALMIFAGINCIVSNFVTKDNIWIPLILVVLGKLGATASFNGLFLTSAELFPTVVRNNGMGAASSFSRLGALLSPLILGLSMYGSWIPLSFYGILGIVAGSLIILLPEMKDYCLLQTLQDMDNI